MVINCCAIFILFSCLYLFYKILVLILAQALFFVKYIFLDTYANKTKITPALQPRLSSLAEGEGFEPSVRFTARRFSRPVPSTTRSPFQHQHQFKIWRRRGDSNSRYRSLRTNDLANRPLQPLGYSSRSTDRVYHISAIIHSFIGKFSIDAAT